MMETERKKCFVGKNYTIKSTGLGLFECKFTLKWDTSFRLQVIKKLVTLST